MRTYNILPAALLIVLLCLCASAQPYTHIWWGDGLRGPLRDGERWISLRTDQWGAAFDVNTARLRRFGVKPGAAYGDSVGDATEEVAGLPDAAMEARILWRGATYRCTKAAMVKDHMHYPVRLIESGRWLQRFDVQGLEFAADSGEKLDVEGRLEVCAWPQSLRVTLEVSPQAPMEGAVLELESTLQPQVARADVAATRTTSVQQVWTAQGECVMYPEDPAGFFRWMEDSDTAKRDAPIVSTTTGAVTASLPAEHWPMAENLDRLERHRFRVSNPGDSACTVPLVFAMEGGFQGITGMCAFLRDKEGNPTAIPVQIAKNWHRQPEERMLYEGGWFHAVTQIPLAAGACWEGELAICYARWGGVPAASHAQLCLIGYGGNQRWDQAAIGSFGESICYDPDVGLNRAMVDDVRPLMVRGMNDGQWEWTHNVGGGDFLVYFDGVKQKRWLKQMRAAYLSHGPNLSDVVYTGLTDDGKMAVRMELMTPRCDDVNRAYHKFRYDVREPVEFSRLAFYQVGADNYNDHQFTRMARGNREGLTEEWEPGRGGNAYLREATALEGESPWVALLGGIRSKGKVKGAWADRGLVVREWKARLGGHEVTTPFLAVYGTENGIPSANAELSPPPGLKQLLPGDFVEAEVELLVTPQKAEDYYGPNGALRKDLAENGGTWRSVHRLAALNTLEVTVTQGKLLERLPVKLEVDGKGAVACTIHGGAGFVPVSFVGVQGEYVLLVDGKPLDQAVHGKDFWQRGMEEGREVLTYNVLLDGKADTQLELARP